jgi:hypothetical protein
MATDKPTIKTWRHSRKGLITGTIIKDSGDFVSIELAGEQTLRLLSRGSSPYFEDGEVISVRKEFLTEVPE